MDTVRYFIAIIPPEEIRSELEKLKLKISGEYNTKGALRSPPHITLQMPFQKPPGHEDKLVRSLESFAKKESSFDLTLQDYGFFEPRVFFIDVKPCLQLDSLQARLVSLIRTKHHIIPKKGSVERSFRPHLTMAFRDLKKSEFYRLKEDYADKTYSKCFEVSNFTLLRHDGKRWQEHYSFSLEGSS